MSKLCEMQQGLGARGYSDLLAEIIELRKEITMHLVKRSIYTIEDSMVARPKDLMTLKLTTTSHGASADTAPCPRRLS